jgi:hypothetical protein
VLQENTVSITALSAVGAAFSAGGDAGCGDAVCAATPELNVRTPASTAIVIHDPFACDIAVSFLDSLRDGLGPLIIARLPQPVNRNRRKMAVIARCRFRGRL